MIYKISASVAALIASLTLVAAPSQAGDAPSADKATPEVYKLVTENKQWRVIRATWQPGQEDNFHSHPGDRVSLFQTDCKLRLSKPDGKFKDVSPKAGKAKARTGKPVNSHKAKNMGDKPCVITIVELK